MSAFVSFSVILPERIAGHRRTLLISAPRIQTCCDCEEKYGATRPFELADKPWVFAEADKMRQRRLK